MVRKKRKLKKKLRVIFIVILCIILVGGILVFMLNNNKNNYVKKSDKERVSRDDRVSNDLKKAPSNSLEYDNMADGNYVTSKGYTLKKESGLAYVDGNLIVNKTYSLPDTFVPQNPYSGSVNSDWCINCIDKNAMEAFKLMQADARSLGLNIYIASGYRGYSKQVTLYNNYVKEDGKDAADRYSARAGHSEHQSGLCFDLNSVNDSFANTNEGKWVNDNAYLYGFVIRFPDGLENETGYQYESWHLRYVGKELAKTLYNGGKWLSLEGYYGLSSVY